MATRAALLKIVDKARDDKEFFHALVFDPERALAGLEGLDEPTKEKLRLISPETFFVPQLVQLAWRCAAGVRSDVQPQLRRHMRFHQLPRHVWPVQLELQVHLRCELRQHARRHLEINRTSSVTA